MIGFLCGTVLRIRRRQVEGAMRAAGIEDPRDASARMYRALGTSLVEFLAVSASKGMAPVEATIEQQSLEAWRTARALGRGIVIAAAHTGNWDIAACAMAREIELLVVTKRLRVRCLDRIWQETRARHGVVLTEGCGALAGARRVLRQGGAVALMIDQVPDTSKHAVRVEFLGAPAWVDTAPAALAARARAPLVVAASRRDGSGEHVLHVLAVHVPPERPARDWVIGVTRQATQALDAFVRAHPAQWLWLHRRWRDPLPPRVDRRPPPSTLPAPWKIRSSSQGARSEAV